MKVLVSAILAKIPGLPVHYPQLVKLRALSTGRADVRSFRDEQLDGSPPAWYQVSIRPHKDDPGDRSILDATCECSARKLCHHITAMYAVAKADDPAVITALVKRERPQVETEEGTAPEHVQPKETPLAAVEPESANTRGLKLIAESQRLFAEAAQALADGIGLVVLDEPNKRTGK